LPMTRHRCNLEV